MNVKQILGLVALAVGVVLLIFGWQAMQTAHEQMAMQVAGHYTRKTIYAILLGVALAVGGAAAVIFLRKK